MASVDFTYGMMGYRLTDEMACSISVRLPALNAIAAVQVLRGALNTPMSLLAGQIRFAFQGIDGGRGGAPSILPSNLADQLGTRVGRGQMMLVAYDPQTLSMIVNRVDEAPPRATAGDPSLAKRVERVIYGLDDVPASAIDAAFRAEFERLKTELTSSPALFGLMLTVIVAWAASHATPPVGFAIDAVLLGLVVFALGAAAFDWVGRFVRLLGRINDAKTDANYDECSAELARLIVSVGISVFITILLRAAGRKLGRTTKSGEPELKVATGQRPARTTPASPSVIRAKAAPPVTKTVTVSNGYRYTRDEQGRVTEVSAQLRRNRSQIRNQRAQRAAGGKFRRSTDEGGHFIGRRFDGPTQDFNHFAQDRRLNRSGYKILENEWERALKEGKTVDVVIRPNYPGKSLRPDSVTVFYKIDGVVNKQVFLNGAGG